jgi:hypothetical protein
MNLNGGDKMKLRINILLTVAVLISAIAEHNQGPAEDFVTILQNAFEKKISGIQIHGYGTVIRLLEDDTDGSRHQRCIIRISPIQTLLIAHNIDIADRVPGLQNNTTLEFYGVYEWSAKGGTIHWTHHDPDGSHIDGWLKYVGKVYQ